MFVFRVGAVHDNHSRFGKHVSSGLLLDAPVSVDPFGVCPLVMVCDVSRLFRKLSCMHCVPQAHLDGACGALFCYVCVLVRVRLCESVSVLCECDCAYVRFWSHACAFGLDLFCRSRLCISPSM